MGSLEMCAEVNSDLKLGRDQGSGALVAELPVALRSQADVAALVAAMMGGIAGTPITRRETGEPVSATSIAECSRCLVFQARAPDSAAASLLGPRHTVSLQSDSGMTPGGAGSDPSSGSQTLAANGANSTGDRSFLLGSSRGGTVVSHLLRVDKDDFAGVHVAFDNAERISLNTSVYYESPRTYLFDFLKHIFGTHGTFDVAAVFDRDLETASFDIAIDTKTFGKKLAFECGYSHQVTDEEAHIELTSSGLRLAVDASYPDGRAFSEGFAVDVALNLDSVNMTFGYAKTASGDQENHTLSYEISESLTEKLFDWRRALPDADDGDNSTDAGDGGGWFDDLGNIFQGKTPGRGLVDKLFGGLDGFDATPVREAMNRTSEAIEKFNDKVRSWSPVWLKGRNTSGYVDGSWSEWLNRTMEALNDRRERIRAAKVAKEPIAYLAWLDGSATLVVNKGMYQDAMAEAMGWERRLGQNQLAERAMTWVGAKFAMDGHCLGDDGERLTNKCRGKSCCYDSLMATLAERFNLAGPTLNTLHTRATSMLNITKLPGDQGYDVTARLMQKDRNTSWAQMRVRRSEDVDSITGVVYSAEDEQKGAIVLNRSLAGDTQTFQAVVLGASDDTRAALLLADTRLDDGRAFELSAYRSKNRMLVFTNFSWLHSRGAAAVDWALGPHRDKVIRSSFTTGWSNSGAASFGLEVTMATTNLVKVDGAVDRGSTASPMGLWLAAAMGRDWRLNIFNFSSSLSGSIYEVEVDRERLLLVENPVDGGIVFDLWGFRFLNIELGLHESTFGHKVITKCVVRQGPLESKLGSGTLELDTGKKEKINMDLHVENAWKVRLFKFTTEVDKADRNAEGKILYGLYKFGLSGDWSDGFEPNPDKPGVSTLSVSLGMKVSIFTVSVGCDLDRAPDGRISVSLADLTVMQKSVKWRDGKVDVDFSPALPAPIGSFSYTKFESTLTLADASSFNTQDFAAAVAAAVDLPQGPSGVSVELHGAAVEARFTLDEDHGEPEEVDRVAELEVGLAIATVCGVKLDTVAVKTPSRRLTEVDIATGLTAPRKLTAWTFDITIAAGSLSNAVAIARRAADVASIDRELRELVPPAPKLEATASPAVVLKLSAILRAEGAGSPPAPPSTEQLRFQLADRLGLGTEAVYLEISELSSKECHGGVCVDADPAEVETNQAVRRGSFGQWPLAAASALAVGFIADEAAQWP